jgi:3-deoxy-7-phosphoheptulonate synthase
LYFLLAALQLPIHINTLLRKSFFSLAFTMPPSGVPTGVNRYGDSLDPVYDSSDPASVKERAIATIDENGKATYGELVAKEPLNGAPSSEAQTHEAEWTPSTWRHKPIKQSAIYEDLEAVQKSRAKLEHLPPIATPTEIIRLKASLRDVALGKAFLLQGGDCAELFDYCEEGAIESKIKLLLQMSLVLIWGANKPVVRIARMAGQYAKPRSSPTEVVEGKETPSFRGDILNGYALDERALDPSRLVR